MKLQKLIISLAALVMLSSTISYGATNEDIAGDWKSEISDKLYFIIHFDEDGKYTYTCYSGSSESYLEGDYTITNDTIDVTCEKSQGMILESLADVDILIDQENGSTVLKWGVDQDSTYYRVEDAEDTTENEYQPSYLSMDDAVNISKGVVKELNEFNLEKTSSGYQFYYNTEADYDDYGYPDFISGTTDANEQLVSLVVRYKNANMDACSSQRKLLNALSEASNNSDDVPVSAFKTVMAFTNMLFFANTVEKYNGNQTDGSDMIEHYSLEFVTESVTKLYGWKTWVDIDQSTEDIVFYAQFGQAPFPSYESVQKFVD